MNLDAYQYFGTSDTYLTYFLKFVKPGAEVGIVVPGLREEFTQVPEHLQAYWNADVWCFHSPTWWQHHWGKTGLVKGLVADWLEDGWEQWLLWWDETRATAFTR